MAKEIGFNVLELKVRPTTYSWLDFGSFEEILNNFYASYFAGALLISKESAIEKTSEFFSAKYMGTRQLCQPYQQFHTLS